MVRRRLRAWDLSRPTPGLFLSIGMVVFGSGLLAGFALSVRLDGLAGGSFLRFFPMEQFSWLRFWNVWWSYFRWLLLSSLLAMTALGLFLLFPLVFLRGLLMGFSFSVLFVSGSYFSVLFHFLLCGVLTCPILLLLSAVGMTRGVCELRGGALDGNGLFTRPAAPLWLLLVGAVFTVLCCFAELWLLPGFVSYL